MYIYTYIGGASKKFFMRFGDSGEQVRSAFWPLQDIVFLRGCCARINHLCIPPRPPALPTLVQYDCTIIRHSQRLPLGTLVCNLCTIQYWY